MAQVRASLKATSPDQGNTPPAKQGNQSPGGPSGNPPPSSPPVSPRGAIGPIRITPPQIGIVRAQSLAEKNLKPKEGSKIQAALCLTPDSRTVTFGPPTRAAIQLFRTVPGQTGPAGGLTALEVIELTTAPSCDRTQFANAFEYFEYRTDNRAMSKDKIERLQTLLRAKVPPGKTPAPDTGRFDSVTRTAIGDIQEANGRKRTGQVTRDFLELLQ